MISSQKYDSNSIEGIILRHSARGMTLLREFLEPDYCMHAARSILALKRGTILLATGFVVGDVPETDGPPGTYALAKSLQLLGFHPVILTDQYCRGMFEQEGFEVIYSNVGDDVNTYQQLLDQVNPVAMISIERCGQNRNGDYANMRGVSITSKTAPIDLAFDLAIRNGIFTIGIGDGGNEIGMGNLATIIDTKLSLLPCITSTSELIIATTSNWGAFGLCACLYRLIKLENRTEQPVHLSSVNHVKQTTYLPAIFPEYTDVLNFTKRIVAQGAIDGVSHQQEATVDGFSVDTERELYAALKTAVNH